MQGVFVKGHRPKTKKELKEAVAAGHPVELQATSLFGNEYGGDVVDMPEGKTVYVAGPDPYTSRKWYATITRSVERITVK